MAVLRVVKYSQQNDNSSRCIMSTPKTEEQRERRRETSRNWYNANKERAKKTRRQHYLNNKEKYAILGKEWKDNNKELQKKLASESYHRRKLDPLNIKHYLLKHAKARAVQKGIEFNLVEDDIVLPDSCPIMGLSFNRSTRKYGYSLDRKDPTKGYTKDNVWVISQIANAMKWDSTHEERVLFAKWVLSLEGGVLP